MIGFYALADEVGLETILGAFAAGVLLSLIDRDHERFSLSPRTGTSTPPRSPPWQNHGPSTISTVSRQSSLPSNILPLAHPISPKGSPIWSNPHGSASTTTAGASSTASGPCSPTPSPRPTYDDRRTRSEQHVAPLRDR